MNNRRIHCGRPRSEVEGIVAEYERSGLTQREFARRRGLKLTTLQYWLYRRAGRSSPDLVEVEVPAGAPSSGATHYRLEFPGGKALSVSGPVHVEELEQLCRLLRD